jgi:hypothetical protein
LLGNVCRRDFNPKILEKTQDLLFGHVPFGFQNRD